MKNRKPQKPDPQSVSTEAGLAATTRYPSGRPVGGETFLLTSPFIERLWHDRLAEIEYDCFEHLAARIAEVSEVIK